MWYALQYKRLVKAEEHCATFFLALLHTLFLLIPFGTQCSKAQHMLSPWFTTAAKLPIKLELYWKASKALLALPHRINIVLSWLIIFKFSIQFMPWYNLWCSIWPLYYYLLLTLDIYFGGNKFLKPHAVDYLVLTMAMVPLCVISSSWVNRIKNKKQQQMVSVS